MAGGIANTTNLANTIRELYDKPFANLRDTTNTFLSRIERKDWAKKTYDWLVRDAYYSAVWSAAESNQSDFITSTVVATDGLGSATAYLAPNNHPYLKASVPIKINYGAIQVTGLTKSALAGAPGAYADALKDETEQALLDFMRALNVQAVATAKAQTNDMDNLGTLFATGAYAGINQATWNPSIDSTTTILQISPMQTLWNNLHFGTETLANTVGATATIREGNVKEIWCNASQLTNYLNLLSGQRMYAPKDTLDAGVKGGNTGVTFNGAPLIAIPRFPTGYLVFYSGEMYHVVLENLGTDDLSQNFTDATFVRLKQYSNLALKNRKVSGLFNALT